MGFCILQLKISYINIKILVSTASPSSTEDIFLCARKVLCFNCTCVSVSPVDIREIKEIRSGQKSRDSERYAEDSAARPDQAHCFVILYGTEFRLKSLSLAGTHRHHHRLTYLQMYKQSTLPSCF